MAVNVTKLSFYDEYFGYLSPNGAKTDSTGTSYIKGCVGDRVWAVIDFTLDWTVGPTPMTFDSSTNTITANDCNFDGFVSSNFQSGDTIIVSGTGGADDTTYSVTNVTQSVLTVEPSSIPVSGGYPAVTIIGMWPASGYQFDLYYNLVPANANSNSSQVFNSLSDANVQQHYQFHFTGSTSPDLATGTPVGTSLAWQDDQNFLPTIQYFETGLYYQIILPMVIKPINLAGQQQLLQNLKNGNGSVVPSYFTNGNSLKFIYDINCTQEIGNTVVSQETTGNQLQPGGQTAFYNFPLLPQGGAITPGKFAPEFQLNSLIYTDADGNRLPALDANAVTYVTAVINQNPSLSPGPADGDYMVLNFAAIPSSASQYQNVASFSGVDFSQADYRGSMLWDRVFVTVGGSSANGDKFGTADQVIADCQATVYSPFPSAYQVTFQVDPGTNISDYLSNSSWYYFWLTPQKHNGNESSLLTSLRNSVLLDVVTPKTNTDDPTQLTVDTQGPSSPENPNIAFFKYPDTYQHPYTNMYMLAGEQGLFQYDFYCPFKSSVDYVNVYIDAVIYDTTNSNPATNVVGRFNLENWLNNTKSNFNGTYTNVNIATARNNGTSSPWNTRAFYADGTVFTNFQQYRLQYGFQAGYQWWQKKTPTQQLALAASPAQSLSTPAVSFNGSTNPFVNVLTQYWAAYLANDPNTPIQLALNQEIKLQVTVAVGVTPTSTGVQTQFVQQADLFVYDKYITPSDLTQTVTFFDNTFAHQIGSIDTNHQTGVEYSLLGASASAIPSPFDSYVGEMYATYTVQNGGVVFDRCSSEEPLGNGSIWVTKPVVTAPSVSPSGSEVIIQAVMDASRFPGIKNINVTSKLSYKI